MSDLNSPVRPLVKFLNTNKCPLRRLADPEILPLSINFIAQRAKGAESLKFYYINWICRSFLRYDCASIYATTIDTLDFMRRGPQFESRNLPTVINLRDVDV